MLHFRFAAAAALAAPAIFAAATGDVLVVPNVTGRPGGTLVFAQRTNPQTLNPATAADSASREVIQRINADLIHINRATQLTEPALAKAWTVSQDGLHYTLELRRGIRFSDGYPFNADDVLFSFKVYLDEKSRSPQRDLLLLDGTPIQIRKLDDYRVAFDLARPYAAAERLFDGFAMLPQHRLAKAWQEGKLAEAWSLSTPPSQIAGLGPFRVKEVVSGQRVVLERNPYYWKQDQSGTPLPYLAALEFVFAGSEDLQVMRFQSGESDVISRISARNFAVLEKEQQRRGYTLTDVGPGLEFSILVFNLNDLTPAVSDAVKASRPFLARESFRKAVSAAIDRDAIVRLVYQGRAASLSTFVPPGDKAWVNRALPPIARSLDHARQLLKADGFSWAPNGALRDPTGKPIEFSIATSSNNAERVQMAAMIQDDLKPLGITVHVASLDFASLMDRVTRTHDYEACLLTLSEADADPNTDVSVLLSTSDSHLWHPGQPKPATPWEAEIDRLMQQQMAAPNQPDRKRMFDRVQAILMDHLPMIQLVSPHILVGARSELGNFKPALMDHYALWNVEELFWRSGVHN